MPEAQNIVVRELRIRLPSVLYLMLTGFLILTFLTVPRVTYSSGEEGISVDRYTQLDVVERDVFIVYIKPNLEHVSVRCEPLDGGNPFDLSVSTDYTDDLFGKVTAIWVRPGARGRYNFTLSFESNETWDYVVGAYSQNLQFYTDFYGKNIKTYEYFVELRGPYTRLAGNWTINVMIMSHGRSSNPFLIELPTPVNSVLLVTAAGFIAYLNVFVLFDTYYKNKKETVSARRWILSGILVAVSAYVIYQLYSFTTFTLPGGV